MPHVGADPLDLDVRQNETARVARLSFEREAKLLACHAPGTLRTDQPLREEVLACLLFPVALDKMRDDAVRSLLEALQLRA